MSKTQFLGSVSLFKAYRTGNFNIPLGASTIPYNSILFDRLNEYTAAPTYLFTAKKTCYYMFNAWLVWLNPLAGTQRMELTITSGGTVVTVSRLETGTVNDQFLNCSGIAHLNRGDTAYVDVFNGGANVRTGSAGHFEGYRIR
jgi:hypothetical protein